MGLLSEHYLRGTLVVRREAEEKAGGFKIGLKNIARRKGIPSNYCTLSYLLIL